MPLFHHKSDEEKRQEEELKRLQSEHQTEQADSLRSLEAAVCRFRRHAGSANLPPTRIASSPVT